MRWCDARSDSFLSDTHGRDAWAEAALAFDDKGKLLAGEVTCHANSGTYRGAGRPEAVYYMERAMDLAAREMGIDAVELRQRNLIRPEQMPYKAASGLTYDSGAFETVLDMAIKASDWDGFEARRAQSAGNGLLRGRGISCYLEVTGPSAREMDGLRFEDDGSVTMVSGSLDYGQGHLTRFAQVVASRLHIPIDRLTLLQGDVNELIAGSGTGGSRTMIAAGALLLKASDLVIENGRQLLTHVLEAAVDIEFEHGQFRIAGTDHQMAFSILPEKCANWPPRTPSRKICRNRSMPRPPMTRRRLRFPMPPMWPRWRSTLKPVSSSWSNIWWSMISEI